MAETALARPSSAKATLRALGCPWWHVRDVDEFVPEERGRESAGLVGAALAHPVLGLPLTAAVGALRDD